MRTSRAFTICDVTVHPGEKAALALPLPEQHSCTPMYMPIRVICGKESGPCLLLFSAVDGNEFNGLEIVNRLIENLQPSEIRGTVVGVPVLNVYGLTHFPKLSPSGQSLTASFPGAKEGNYGERIASIFTEELLKKSDVCIELQTGSLCHDILPQVYCQFENSAAKSLACSFGVPVVTRLTTEGNPLRETVVSLNVPFLVYRGGEAMRFSEAAIQTGFRGILNTMKSLGMLKGQTLEESDKRSDSSCVFAHEEEWIKAPVSGILYPDIDLGTPIKKGGVIGRLGDPFSNEAPVLVKADQDGVVVGINRTPLVHEGLSIFKIASFASNEKAQALIGNWGEEQRTAEDND